MTPQQIAAVQSRDRHDVVMLGKGSIFGWMKIVNFLLNGWRVLHVAIAGWWRK
jgi:hypothetical protein